MSSPEAPFNGAGDPLSKPPGEPKKRKRGATRLSCAECRRSVSRSGDLSFRLTPPLPFIKIEAAMRPCHSLWFMRQERLRGDMPRRYDHNYALLCARSNAPIIKGSLTTGKGNR